MNRTPIRYPSQQSALVPFLTLTPHPRTDPLFLIVMKAKKKPLVTLSPADFSVDIAPRLQVIKLSEPEERKGGGKVGSVDELVEKLKAAGLV